MNVKWYHSKKIQESFLCNSAWQWGMKYKSSLSTNDHKSKAHIGLNFEHLGMGLILVQVPQKNKPQNSSIVLGHGINLNNSNVKLEKDRLLWGSFDPRLKDTSTIQNNTIFGYGG